MLNIGYKAPQASTGSTGSSFFAAPPKPAEANVSSAAPTAPGGGTFFSGGLFGKKPDTPASGATPASSTSGTPAPVVPSVPPLFGAGLGAKKDDDTSKDKTNDQAPKPGVWLVKMCSRLLTHDTGRRRLWAGTPEAN